MAISFASGAGQLFQAIASAEARVFSSGLDAVRADLLEDGWAMVGVAARPSKASARGSRGGEWIVSDSGSANQRSDQMARERARQSTEHFVSSVQRQLDAGDGELQAASRLPMGRQSHFVPAAFRTAGVSGETKLLVDEWHQ